MRRLLSVVAFAIATFGLGAGLMTLRGDGSSPEEAPACTAAKPACGGEAKVTQLLEEWKATLASFGTGCPTKRAEVAERLGAVEAECTIGSRMAATLAYTRDVLAASVAVDPECAKEDGAHAGCEGTQLLHARSRMAQGLAELASYAVEGLGAASGKAGETCSKAAGTETSVAAGGGCSKAVETAVESASGCSKETALAVATAGGCSKAAACCAGQQGPGCGKEGPGCVQGDGACCAAEGNAGCCAKKGECGNCGKCSGCAGCGAATETAAAYAKSGCPKALAAAASELRASWEKVPGELASMCPSNKKELFAAMESLERDSKVVALLPETVLLLAEGLEQLDAVQGQILEAAKAHPDAHANLPPETVKAFDDQAKLVREAAGVLKKVKVAMGALQNEMKPAEAVALGE